MSIPSPQNGLVIRYNFLWQEEDDAGLEEAAKARPCAIILVGADNASGAEQITVVPVTHSPPRDGQAALALQPEECGAAGLDDGQHWVVLEETNSFIWPGYDLRKIPGTEDYHYGRLTQGAYTRIVKALLRLNEARKAAGEGPVTAIPRD